MRLLSFPRSVSGLLQQRLQRTITTTFHSPFKNCQPILLQQKLNVFHEVMQQVATLSFNKLQHLVTFVEQQMLYDVEPCVTGFQREHCSFSTVTMNWYNGNKHT